MKNFNFKFLGIFLFIAAFAIIETAILKDQFGWFRAIVMVVLFVGSLAWLSHYSKETGGKVAKVATVLLMAGMALMFGMGVEKTQSEASKDRNEFKEASKGSSIASLNLQQTRDDIAQVESEVDQLTKEKGAISAKIATSALLSDAEIRKMSAAIATLESYQTVINTQPQTSQAYWKADWDYKEAIKIHGALPGLKAMLADNQKAITALGIAKQEFQAKTDLLAIKSNRLTDLRKELASARASNNEAVGETEEAEADLYFITSHSMAFGGVITAHPKLSFLNPQDVGQTLEVLFWALVFGWPCQIGLYYCSTLGIVSIKDRKKQAKRRAKNIAKQAKRSRSIPIEAGKTKDSEVKVTKIDSEPVAAELVDTKEPDNVIESGIINKQDGAQSRVIANGLLTHESTRKVLRRMNRPAHRHLFFDKDWTSEQLVALPVAQRRDMVLSAMAYKGLRDDEFPEFIGDVIANRTPKCLTVMGELGLGDLFARKAA